MEGGAHLPSFVEVLILKELGASFADVRISSRARDRPLQWLGLVNEAVMDGVEG